MTDEELLSQYVGYSDEQLAEFILQGIPDWQKAEFQHLLILRRRGAYEEIAGVTELPDKPEPPRKLLKKKGINSGCAVLLFLLFLGVLVIFVVVFSHP